MLQSCQIPIFLDGIKYLKQKLLKIAFEAFGGEGKRSLPPYVGFVGYQGCGMGSLMLSCVLPAQAQDDGLFHFESCSPFCLNHSVQQVPQPTLITSLFFQLLKYTTCKSRFFFLTLF